MPPPAAARRLLRLRLLRGSGLAARDLNGYSDPYVKFELANRLLGRSRVVRRCLDPVWDQGFEFDLSDCPDGDLVLRVFDWDALSPADDYIGHCRLPLGALCVGELHTFCLPLTGDTRTEQQPCLGSVSFTAVLDVCLPLPAQPPACRHSPGRVGAETAVEAQLDGSWRRAAAVATVQLLDGSDLAATRPYVELRLGGQRCRSRAAQCGRRPRWSEEFRLQLLGAEDQRLRLAVRDRRLAGRDLRVGRAELQLRRLPLGAARLLRAPIVDGAGELRLLVTVSGVGGDKDGRGDDDHDDGGDDDAGAGAYSLMRTFERVADVGRLTVRLLRTDGISTARRHCTVQLHNTILRTRCGSSSGRFAFSVLDLHASLEVCVFEEPRRPGGRPRLLGRAAIRLLRLLPGRRWYALKDKTLESCCGGRVLLEAALVQNPLRAAIAALRRPEPRPSLPQPRFRVAVLRRNVRRLVSLAEWLSELTTFCSACCSWRRPLRSAAALAAAVGFVWNVSPHLLPLAPLFAVCAGRLLPRAGAKPQEEPEAENDEEEEEQEQEEEEEESSSCAEVGAAGSWLRRVRAAQDALLQVQEAVGQVAEFGERLRHVADWTEPWLSRMALALLLCCSVVLLLLPLRLLAVAWVVGKFAKRLLLPQAADSNEFLNFISRVPSDLDLLQAAAPPPEPDTEDSVRAP